MKRSVTRLFPVGLDVWTSTALTCAVLLVASAHTARAASVVGNGTAASCTDAALNTALTGGGLVTFSCGGGPVTIDISPGAGGTGTKTIAVDTTIDGGSLITISGGHSVGVFLVSGGVKFTVQNLTIANGNSGGNSYGGGGIYNDFDGTLTVTNSTFSGNSAVNFGGGIFNFSTLTVTNTTFAGNSASNEGGGIFNNGGGTLAVTNSTFSGNSANQHDGPGPGGAIYNGGMLAVTGSTFSGNGGVGAISNSDALTVTNSTFSANDGGGIVNRNAVTVTNSTFTGNLFGVVSVNGNINPPTALLRNTLLANSPSDSGFSNCVGSITDGGHNLDDGTSCGFSTANGSLNNTDPKLDPAGLVNNGGPTQTIALQATSPAINAGDESVCAAPPVNHLDQRGFERPGIGHTSCSIGAYEADAIAPCVVGDGTSASCTEFALDACLPGRAVTFNCGGAATITVSSTKTIAADTTIDGGSLITISGGNSVGVFSVNTGVTFTVHNLTIANGYSAGGDGFGGGIRNDGTLTVTSSTFSANSATEGGGGIANDGTLTLTNSTFSGNTAGGGGGGIVNSGMLTVTNNTFSGNWATHGGGIFSSGTLTVTNSTFSGNWAYAAAGAGGGDGGGIRNDGTLTVTNSTFSHNWSTFHNGSGIANGGMLTVTNTILANTMWGNDGAGSVTDGGHNLDDGTTWGFTGTSLSNTDPKLDPAGLANNGGPTQTIALQATSPAINAGDESVCAAPPVNHLDQRGFERPGIGHTSCSIGAYEADAIAPCVVGTGTGASCTESVLDACLPGRAVTFNCGGAATITVTSTKTISADTTIDGGSLITISGGNSVRVFSVDTGVRFTVQNLTIANGKRDCGGGAILNNGGTLTVSNSTFTGNSGGTCYSTNPGAGGGAILNNGGTLTVTNSAFSGNSTGGNGSNGGAIGNFGSFQNPGATLTITNSTFSGNSAPEGGAIMNWGLTATITNSTFAGNSASDAGGGISNVDGTLVVTNTTFSGNGASGGGGGGISNAGDTAAATVTNTIIANSTSGGNCAGGVTDGGHNIDDGTTCGFTGTGCTVTTGTSFCNTNPQLDPAGLKNNGGRTQTVALCTAVGTPVSCTGASPAINAGDESVCSTTTGTAPVDNLDQRGFVRPGVGAANCSIGAFEANSPGPLPACTGDCRGDSRVTVDEILTMVNIALGNAVMSACEIGDANKDGLITVDEIMQAVNNALKGCA